MKIYYNILLVLAVGFFSCSSSRYAYDNYDDNNNNYQQYDNSGPISYQTFYDELSPYGSWINYPGYGYVWAPDQMGFQPYSSNGHWVYSSYGWTWVSNYNWGWAPFHYGRWMNDRFHGWLWVPGYEWAPAWVSWRGGGDYYGWAPLPPGYGIHSSYGSIPYSSYSFVPRRYINSPRINNYYIDRSRNVTIINNTTIINNNITYNKNVINAGPAIRDVEQATNSTIRPVRVVNRSTPGESSVEQGKVAIYKPAVREIAGNKTLDRPVRVISKDELPRRDLQLKEERNIQLENPQRDQADPNSIRRNPQSDQPRTIELPKTVPQRVPVEAAPTRRAVPNRPIENPIPEREIQVPPVRQFPKTEVQEQRRNQRIERPDPQPRPQMQRESQQPAPRPVERIERVQRREVQPQVREQQAPVREFRPVKESPVNREQ